MKDAPELPHLSEEECPNILIRLPKAPRPQNWDCTAGAQYFRFFFGWLDSGGTEKILRRLCKVPGRVCPYLFRKMQLFSKLPGWSSQAIDSIVPTPLSLHTTTHDNNNTKQHNITQQYKHNTHTHTHTPPQHTTTHNNTTHNTLSPSHPPTPRLFLRSSVRRCVGMYASSLSSPKPSKSQFCRLLLNACNHSIFYTLLKRRLGRRSRRRQKH